MDTYTRVVLTVIAVALVVIAVRGVSNPVPPAVAAEAIDCTISNGLTISDFRDSLDIKGELDVEVKQGFNQPGSSSGSPLYVKMVD